jgi:dUTP pyrophosphatase
MMLWMPPVDVAILPHYAGGPLVPVHEHDVGIDLFAATDITLHPGERAIVPTGIAMAIPPGYEAQIRPTSGNAAKLGLTVLNAPGTIDPTYRGEIGVIAHNTNPVFTLPLLNELLDILRAVEDSHLSPFEVEAFEAQASEQAQTSIIHISRGGKIAQLVFAKYERPILRLRGTLDQTVRGEAGFGSTGTAVGTVET